MKTDSKASVKRKLAAINDDAPPQCAKKQKVSSTTTTAVRRLTVPTGFKLRTDQRLSMRKTVTTSVSIDEIKPVPTSTTNNSTTITSVPVPATATLQLASRPTPAKPKNYNPSASGPSRTVPQEFKFHGVNQSTKAPALTSEELALEKMKSAPRFKARPAPKKAPFKLKPSAKHLTTPAPFVLGVRKSTPLAKSKLLVNSAPNVQNTSMNHASKLDNTQNSHAIIAETGTFNNDLSSGVVQENVEVAHAPVQQQVDVTPQAKENVVVVETKQPSSVSTSKRPSVAITKNKPPVTERTGIKKRPLLSNITNVSSAKPPQPTIKQQVVTTKVVGPSAAISKKSKMSKVLATTARKVSNK